MDTQTFIDIQGNCTWEVDNYGQIVIYTGLMLNENDEVVPYRNKEENE